MSIPITTWSENSIQIWSLFENAFMWWMRAVNFRSASMHSLRSGAIRRPRRARPGCLASPLSDTCAESLTTCLRLCFINGTSASNTGKRGVNRLENKAVSLAPLCWIAVSNALEESCTIALHCCHSRERQSMQFKRLHVDSTTGLVLVASPTMSDGGSFFFRGLTGGPLGRLVWIFLS